MKRTADKVGELSRDDKKGGKERKEKTHEMI